MSSYDKMVLVPSDLLSTLALQQKLNPVWNRLTELDKEATDILFEKGNGGAADTHERAQQFDKLRRTFDIIRKQEQEKPLKIQLADGGGENRLQPLTNAGIKRNIAKKYAPRAEALLEHLERMPGINWGPAGQLEIDREPLQGTDIRNIVNYYVRPKKSGEPPEGYQAFVNKLRGTNPPNWGDQPPVAAAAAAPVASGKLYAPITPSGIKEEEKKKATPSKTPAKRRKQQVGHGLKGKWQPMKIPKMKY